MGLHRRRKWRIYQFLSAMGVVKSKKDAVVLARSGKITVDGSVIKSLHYQVNPRKQVLRVDGRHLELKENRRYVILNKPKGLVVTKENILNLLKLKDASLAPVGRLDRDTTGLILVTNDGRLGRRVLDPKTKRYKVYHAKIVGKLSEYEAERLRKGIFIDVDEQKYKTLPAKVRILRSGEASLVELKIIEGKKRQVKKMFEAVGHPVVELERVAIAGLKLSELPTGKTKELSKEEIYGLLFE